MPSSWDITHSRFGEIEGSARRMHAGPMKVTPTEMNAYFDPAVDPTSNTGNAKAESRAFGDIDPHLIWRDAATPASRRFDDVYYSDDGGLAESRHTFLAGNGLPDAWVGRDCFVIAETGFGTGLNFLATWQTWRRTAPAGATLHYLSVEGFPLTTAQILTCLAPWPELTHLANELAAVYPPIHDGFHRVWLEGGRVVLTLLIGDVASVLPEAEARVDAWFLDGFSPARNPEMWTPEIFTEIARLSAPGATLATYTVARGVRQDLAMAGFQLEARPGFGRKREMLVGKFTAAPLASRIPPWYRPPPAASRDGLVAILGAGIAGCAVAGALERRGKSALLIDRHPSLSSEASGNPLALIAPRVERGRSDAALFHDRAYRMTLASIAATGLDWDARGALRIMHDHEPPTGLWPGAAVSLSADIASERAGIAVGGGGLWYPEAGVIQPKAFADVLARGAEERLSRAVGGVEHDGQAWHVRDDAGTSIIEAETVVVALAGTSTSIAPLDWLPSRVVLGQMSLVPPSEATAALKTTLIWGGYLTPALGGRHILGATHERSGFDPTAWPQPVTMPGHERNHRETPAPVRDLLPEPNSNTWEGRAAFRCTLPDHLPAAGPVVVDDAYLSGFDRLRHGPRGVFPTVPQYHPGLHVMTGLGGRGITTATLAAELMVSQMLGEPWPIERRAALSLAPARFLVRRLRRPSP
jgi:tRNA 5-methylaminomethyl-2-thiouridine biosynthesis bifunctional protein